MKKLSLWILAAVLVCSTSLVTTSCETLLKVAVDVAEGVKVAGVWEVTSASSNSAGFTTGATWTFDTNLTYTASTGESGTWGLAQSTFSLTPKGKSEFNVGTLETVNKKEMVINLATGGTVKFKKIANIESSK